jgi:hypothetical protein
MPNFTIEFIRNNKPYQSVTSAKNGVTSDNRDRKSYVVKNAHKI